MRAPERAPLLATKLHPPRPRRGAIRRTRLSGRQTEDLPALTLVSAPAGFGKSTLLAEWMAPPTPGEPCTAWLSLDVGDDDLAVFWAYLVASLQAAAPGAGERSISLLEATHPPASVASSLLNDLAAVTADLVLVLDDYHVIDTAGVHETVAFLVDHAPPQLHLVIATRADPPLPLARLRARGDLLEIRAADLRFTTEETAAYFDGVAGLRLTDDEVAALEARTEGWVAALQLAALSMQGRSDPGAFIEDFAGDDRFVVDYLAEEVLDRQPDDVRRFLLHTSILDRFTSELCDAVTGTGGAKPMLDRLDRSNLFLVPLDDRRHWYRYHHLFADVLRARLLDEQPDLVAELHCRAGDWYATRGDVSQAIAHAMAGADFEKAAHLVEAAAPVLRRRRQEGTLRRWLEALPDDVFRRRPVLAVDLVGARMASGDTSGVEALIGLAETAIDPTAPPAVAVDQQELAALPVQLLVYRAALALLAGDVAGTVTHAGAALEAAGAADHLRRGSASALLALAHWATGDLSTAERLYTEAIAALVEADHLPDALGCSLALADVQIAQGRLGAAARTLRTGLEVTAANPGLWGAADMHIGLSEILIERNELDSAAEHLLASAELGDSAGLPQHAYRWRVTMARLSRARGDVEGALALIDEAAPLYDTDFSPPVRPVDAIRARVQLAGGDLAAALDWVADRGLAPADELSYVREYEHVTLARVLIAQHAATRDPGVLAGAIALLDRLLVAAEEGRRSGSLIEVRILQVAAELARGDSAAATAALEDAVRLAEPEGHVRLFLHAGPGVTVLLRAVASRSDATGHARRILEWAGPAASEPSANPRARERLVGDLSARELDVLRLLRSDLSGPDIARELYVSLNTLRTHTRNIYSKLGVNTRREAVTRAAELGL